MRMKRQALAGCVLALCAVLARGGEVKPDRLVSENTLIYISAPDLLRGLAALERTAFQALLREDEVSQPLLLTIGRIRDAYIKGDGTRSESELRRRTDEVALLGSIGPLLMSDPKIKGLQVALAIEEGDRILVAVSMPQETKSAEGKAVEGSVEELQRNLEQAMEKYRQAQGAENTKETTVQIGQYSCTVLDHEAVKQQESWAFVDNLFLYGQGNKVVADAVNRLVRNGTGSLSLNVPYQAAYKEVAANEQGEVLLYVQVSDLDAASRRLFSGPRLPDAKAAGAEAGAAKGTEGKPAPGAGPALALGLHISGGSKPAIREKVLLRGPKPAAPVARCAAVSARFAQDDALFYHARQSNMSELHAYILEKIRDGGIHTVLGTPSTAHSVEKGARESAEYQDKVRELLGALQVSDLQSKLDLFKGEMAVFGAYVPKAGANMDKRLDYVQVMQPVFVLELDQENAVAAGNLNTILNNLSKVTGHEYQPQAYVGSGTTSITIHCQKGGGTREDTSGGLFNSLLDTRQEVKKVPFFAAYARVDLEVNGKWHKFLLLSDDVSALKKAVQKAQSGNLRASQRASLADDQRFMDLLRSFRESASWVGYIELAKVVEFYGNELPKLVKANIVSKELLDSQDSSKPVLPAAATLQEFIRAQSAEPSKPGDETVELTRPTARFPMAFAGSAVTEVDATGLLVEFNSPVGNLPLGALIGAAAWPQIIETQQMQVSEEVDRRFKRIWLGLNLYAADFDRYPPQLSHLYPNYVKDLSIFESPFNRGAVKQAADIDVTGLTNLVYVPNKSLQDLGTDLILYEKVPSKLVKWRGVNKIFYHVLAVKGLRAMSQPQLERVRSGKIELPGGGVEDAPVIKGAKPGIRPSASRPPPKPAPRVPPK